jgi:S1-C subfamily serine protease
MMDVKLHKQPSLLKQYWSLAARAGILICALALVGIDVGLPGLATTAQAASSASGRLCTPEKRGVNLALPAVVRLATTYQAQMTYTTADGTSVVFPQNGGFYQLTVAGTGAFISGTGDILTAAHLVAVSQDELGALLIQQAAPDIAQAINNANPAQKVTTADIENQLLSDPSVWQPTYQTDQSVVYLSSQYAGSTTASSVSDLQGLPVTVTAQSSADQPNSTDLALLHVDGLRDLPTIPLGDASQVFQGDTLTILGYPGSADLAASDGTILPNNFLTASVNTVMVSAIKTPDGNSQVLEIAGNVEAGESGGPALNADGQLVGVVSAGAASQASEAGTSFLRMVNDARSLIQQARVNLAQDTFDKRWAAAYDACASTASGHWHDAYAQYTQLAHLYPNFKGVQLYLDYTKAQAAREPAPGGFQLPVWAAILLAVLAVALVIVLVVYFRRRRKLSLAGAYAGYGPGLNRGAPDGTAVFRLGGQPRTPSSAAPPGPSEQVGTAPPDERGELPTPPAAVPTDQTQPDMAWMAATTQPTIVRHNQSGSLPSLTETGMDERGC